MNCLIIWLSSYLTAFNREYTSTGILGGIQVTSELIPAGIAYICLAPIVFMLPLSTAHQAMKTAKDDALLGLSRIFEETYSEIYKIATEDINNKPGLKRLKHIQELYQLTEKFPVWPFNIETLRKFFTSFLSPILLAFIPEIIKIFVE